MLKRAFDIVVSLSGLILLSPLYFFLAIAVWIFDGRPIFYSESRQGYLGRSFRIIKFRTLRSDSEMGSSIAVENDSRITRQGLFLRRWRIDELPQLWNVFCGDLSVVGPRPMKIEHFEGLTLDQVRSLQSVRPGLTDPATLYFIAEDAILSQVKDPEKIYIQKLLPQKVAMQIAYIEHQTLITDFATLLNTVCQLWSKTARQISASDLRRLLNLE